MRSAPATAAVAIDSEKAISYAARMGDRRISRSARLSCDTARMARPIWVRDTKAAAPIITKAAMHGTSVRQPDR